MKYIIIGYTSDIDIKSNTAKIRYLHCDTDGYHVGSTFWEDNISKASKFTDRSDAIEIILLYNLKNCITYGIEE